MVITTDFILWPDPPGLQGGAFRFPRQAPTLFPDDLANVPQPGSAVAAPLGTFPQFLHAATQFRRLLPEGIVHRASLAESNTAPNAGSGMDHRRPRSVGTRHQADTGGSSTPASRARIARSAASAESNGSPASCPSGSGTG